MVMTNFPSDFASGVTIRGMPLMMAYPGKVFWVAPAASGGADGNKGTYDRPFATIARALDSCLADRGDVIMVRPGYSQTITAAAGLDLDVAGVCIVGLGSGSKRPTINFTTAVGADMNVAANNVTLMNFLFTGGIDALTGPIDLNAADTTLINIETRDVTGQATDWIVGDDACDRLRITGWKHLGAAAAGADTALTVVGADDVVIEDFDIYGNFAVAAIEQLTTLGNRWRIGGGVKQSFIWTENAADVAITMKSDTTGWIGPNINIMLQDNAANITECVVAAAMQVMQPINVCNLAGESSMQINITASTDA